MSPVGFSLLRLPLFPPILCFPGFQAATRDRSGHAGVGVGEFGIHRYRACSLTPWVGFPPLDSLGPVGAASFVTGWKE